LLWLLVPGGGLMLRAWYHEKADGADR
jgi:hypothetical protein